MQAIVLAGTHDGTRSDGRAEAAADRFDLDEVEVAGAMLRPHTATVEYMLRGPLLVVTDDHWTGLQNYRRKINAGCSHDLGGQGLIAASDENNRVRWAVQPSSPGVHRHQVA